MASHTPVEADPKEIQRAADMWAGFIKISKYTIIVSIIVLAALGVVFVDW